MIRIGSKIIGGTVKLKGCLEEVGHPFSFQNERVEITISLATRYFANFWRRKRRVWGLFKNMYIIPERRCEFPLRVYHLNHNFSLVKYNSTSQLHHQLPDFQALFVHRLCNYWASKCVWIYQGLIILLILNKTTPRLDPCLMYSPNWAVDYPQWSKKSF